MAEFSGNNRQPNSDGAWEISTGPNSSAGAYSKGDMQEWAQFAWSRHVGLIARGDTAPLKDGPVGASYSS